MSVGIDIEITQMIQWEQKDNKGVITNCIPSVQEVKRELSMLMRDMKDTKI